MEACTAPKTMEEDAHSNMENLEDKPTTGGGLVLH